MRFIGAILFTLMLSTPAFSGGMTGGTGVGRLILEIRQCLKELFKLPILEIDPAATRRMLMRLFIYGKIEVVINGKTIIIEIKDGQLVNIAESSGVLVLPEDESF